MKSLSHLLLLLLVAFAVCGNMNAKGKHDKTIYAIAFGTSFNDSTVYLTNVLPLTDGTINAKSKFLDNRAEYTNQFKQYLDSIYPTHHTCAIFYDKNKKRLDKHLIKLRRRYQKEKQAKLTIIPTDAFKFRNPAVGQAK